jgi:cytochrome c553
MRPIFCGAIVVAAAIAVFVTGCRSPVLPESDGSALAAGLSLVEIHDARKVYLAKCARCHKFYDPAGYTDSDWGEWMTKMSRKARLQEDQERILARYLGAFRTGQKTREAAPE